jgi:hypothetical protein
MAKEMGNAKSYRMAIAYEILMQMEFDQELPQPNKERLGKIMQEYFDREGMLDRVKDDGFTWNPDAEYWIKHMADICDFMRSQYKLYFAFVRDDGEFTGLWKFTNKGEWERTLKRNHQDISTRVDNQNEMIDDTQLRWKIEVPKIQEVPRLS